MISTFGCFACVAMCGACLAVLPRAWQPKAMTWPQHTISPKLLCAAVCAYLLSACSGEAGAAPRPEPSPADSVFAAPAPLPDDAEPDSIDRTEDAPGGMTEDWDSVMPGCASRAWIPFDDGEPLGYPARELLDLATGRFVVPVTWLDGCEEDGGADCLVFEGFNGSALAGTKTEATIELSPVGDLAYVEVPDKDGASCAGGLKIPVSVRLELADGSVALETESVLVSHEWYSAFLTSFLDCPATCEACPPHCDGPSREQRRDLFDATGPAAWLGGTLGAELPDGVQARLGFGVTRGRDEATDLRSMGDTVWLSVSTQPADPDLPSLLWLDQEVLRSEAVR